MFTCPLLGDYSGKTDCKIFHIILLFYIFVVFAFADLGRKCSKSKATGSTQNTDQIWTQRAYKTSISNHFFIGITSEYNEINQNKYN